MGHVGSEEVSLSSSLEVTPTKSNHSTSTQINSMGSTRLGTPSSTAPPMTASTTLASILPAPTDAPEDGGARSEGDLSRRREMVQMLDCEPILDYLIRHGAVTVEQADDLLGSEEEEGDDALEKRNRKLLQIIESQQQSRSLFTNALRLTGQHFLANMADDGVRIKALSGSGYLSKSRHKGQVELYIRVDSLKSTNDVKFLAVSQLLRKNTISLEDIQSKFSSVRRQEIRRNASVRLSAAIDENARQNSTTGDKRKEKKKKKKKESTTVKSKGSKIACLFCGCFGREKKVEVQLTNLVNETLKEPVTQAPTRNGFVVEGRDFSIDGDFDDEDLREVSHTIQAFCQGIYDQLACPQSQLHACLVRYFEQERGVLLLGADSSANKLHLKFICTKADQVVSVERDLESGKLARDMERFVCRWLKESNRNEESVTLDLRVVGGSLDKSREEFCR